MKKTAQYLAFILFTIGIGLFKFGYHELWKDEWQAWFVSNDRSLMEMFSFLNYEGHPALFYIYFKCIGFLGGASSLSPEVFIQSGHLVFVAAMAYVFFVKFKMPLLLKIILALGYCFAFEYCVVNRAYVSVMFFAFWICTMLHNPSKYKYVLPIAFFLLCQTEVYGVFIAIGLYSYYSLKANGELSLALKNSLQNPSFYSLLIGFITFVWTVFPRGNRDDFSRAYKQDWFDIQSILDAFQGLTSNNFLIGSIADTSRYGSSALGLVLGLVVSATLFWLFKSRKNILIAFVLVFAMFFLFAVIIYNGGVRQWGMFYVFFLCMLELSDLKWDKANQLKFIPIVVFALFQLVHSAKSFHRDYSQAFTNALATAEFIKEKVPDAVPIVALNKFESTPVIGYADRKFYALPEGEPFSYFKWLEKVYVPTEQELQLFRQYKKVRGLIVISPQEIDTQRFPNLKIWQQFDSPSYKQENYYLYTLQ